MNIKTLTPSPVVPLDPKARVEGQTRARASSERDANGKQEGAEQETKRHLTDQEFDEAIAALKEFPGLKANDLEIKVEKQKDGRVVLIVDRTGQIVRRLSESQLWLATRDRDKQTGRILDKAM